MLGEPGVLPVEISFQFVVHFFHPVPVGLVLGGRLQPGLLDQAQHLDRAVAALFPENRVQFLEKLQGVEVPAEPEVEGDLAQCLQPFRDPGNHRNMKRPLLDRRDRRCHKGVRMKGLAD